MHRKVTPEIVRTYNEVGVGHVPGAFGADWVARMTALIDRIVAGLRAGTMKFGESQISRPVEFEDHDGYTRLINTFWRVPEMRALVEENDCAAIVADVIGSDSMRPWLDGIFMKEGSAAETATPWHNDECTFPFSGSHSPSMWVALTDVGRDNAPLVTLAGSNKDPHRYFSTFAVQDRVPPPEFHPWSELLARVKAPDADLRVWEAKAGDMLVIHPKTIHSSLPRTATSGGRRLAFSLRWLGSDIRYRFNPTTRDSPFEKHPDIKEGEPLPAALFPITWRRAA
ncbi:MAG: phytanoyl-CoA dioxygenase family protein [Rhodospirillaceae bacterium]|nr:phytanoyl-CoA dioxygenase family protein [Rhodospirillaceae bacterium]